MDRPHDDEQCARGAKFTRLRAAPGLVFDGSLGDVLALRAMTREQLIELAVSQPSFQFTIEESRDGVSWWSVPAGAGPG